MNTKQQIINDIIDCVRKWGGLYSEWYVGVASDARKRLFNDHNVSELYGKGWIFTPCVDANTAREIEQYFLGLGMTGGPGGGDDDAKFVYAYRKTNTTKQ